MPTLRQIEYFVAVAKTGSLSAGARLSNVSQPSLCVQIQQLERKLGARLLSRYSRGVQLTAAGKTFLPHAIAALEELSQAKTAITSLLRADANEISLGLMPTAGRALIEKLVERCKERPCAPKLQIHIDLNDELYELFTDGVLDAAICYTPPPINSVSVVSLYEQELFLVGPRKLLEDSGDVDRRSLRRFPLVLGTRKRSMRKFIDDHMAADSIELVPDFESTLINLKRDLVVRQGCCTIMPYGTFYDEIKSGEICVRRIKPPLSRQVMLVLHKNVSEKIRGFLVPEICSIVKLRIHENEFGWRSAKDV